MTVIQTIFWKRFFFCLFLSFLENKEGIIFLSFKLISIPVWLLSERKDKPAERYRQVGIVEQKDGSYWEFLN